MIYFNLSKESSIVWFILDSCDTLESLLHRPCLHLIFHGNGCGACNRLEFSQDMVYPAEHLVYRSVQYPWCPPESMRHIGNCSVTRTDDPGVYFDGCGLPGRVFPSRIATKATPCCYAPTKWQSAMLLRMRIGLFLFRTTAERNERQRQGRGRREAGMAPMYLRAPPRQYQKEHLK